MDNHDEGTGWDEQIEGRDGNKELYVCMETERSLWLLAALEVVILMTNMALWWPSCFSVKLVDVRKDFSSFNSLIPGRCQSNFINASFQLVLQSNSTGRDRLRLTALTTNHHGGGAKRRICTFVVYGETMQRQHKWSRTDIVVHTVQLMWGIIWNLATELLCIKAVKISAGSS